MENLVQQIMSMNDAKTLFILCGIFIFTDILTGYLKTFKTKNGFSNYMEIPIKI